MLLLIITLILFVVGILLKYFRNNDFYLIITICSLYVLLGELFPSGDYCEWEEPQTTIQLTQLSEENNIYVLETESNTEIIFRYISEDEFKTEEVLSHINRKDAFTLIEIVECEEISQPYMTKTKREGKGSFITFTKQKTQTKYTFYIPNRTRSEENIQEFKY